jgi:lipopolysaccharide/colanic/teichoic acid biosynthesis glycosyltransferase
MMPSASLNKAAAFDIQPRVLEVMNRNPYWTIKRLIDVAASLALLILTTPIMAFIALCCLPTIGRPILFWQQRPGLGGRPFNLYKFRTMKAAYAPDGRELIDEERVSTFGNILRRTRLDELPQLINILRGDMSFIGPRPLLPRDQDDAYRARLLVRPGLTGWAQVVGGRAISAEDKAALDVWYVKHANLLLDLKVVLKTIPIILTGETISRHLIEQAWTDLRTSGTLQSRFSQMPRKHEQAAA